MESFGGSLGVFVGGAGFGWFEHAPARGNFKKNQKNLLFSLQKLIEAPPERAKRAEGRRRRLHPLRNLD